MSLRRAVRRRERRSTPAIGIIGPPWFESLFAPEFRLVRPDHSARSRSSDPTPDVVIVGPGDLPEWTWTGAPVVGYRSPAEPATDPTPFVQPLTSNPSRRATRAVGDLPADFGALAAAARREVTGVRHPGRFRRAPVQPWLDATATAHVDYRRAHRRTALHVVREALLLHGREAIGRDREVAVICATNRPAQLDRVIENYERQSYPDRRLVVITNSRGFDVAEVRDRLADVENAMTIDVDEERSLGECLNTALDAVESRFVAKFDDDDRYGAEYLTDMMIAHRFAGAALVGKHSHYAHISDDGSTHLRFPGREFEYTSWVAGGTMVIDRGRVAGLRFRDLSIGEDGAFIADCQRAGHAVYAADRFNYVQYRTGDNTWSRDRADYLRKAVVEDSSDPISLIER